jgi:hypothetical protein
LLKTQSGQNVQSSKWLSKFTDQPIHRIPIIPGSHNSGSYRARIDDDVLFSMARQQSLPIKDQLSVGIRFLDLRLNCNNPRAVRVSHYRDTFYLLSDVFDDVTRFLREEPTEFVIVYLRVDHNFRSTFDGSDKQQWQSDIRDVLLKYSTYYADFEISRLSKLTVKDLASKIVLMAPRKDFLSDPRPNSLGNPPIVDSETYYKVTDVWKSESESAAKEVLNNFMTTSYEPDLNKFTGLAIDLTIAGTPPVETSPALLNWFTNEFESNKDWRKRKSEGPIGVFLTDFVTSDTLRPFLLHNLEGLDRVTKETDGNPKSITP